MDGSSVFWLAGLEETPVPSEWPEDVSFCVTCYRHQYPHMYTLYRRHLEPQHQHYHVPHLLSHKHTNALRPFQTFRNSHNWNISWFAEWTCDQKNPPLPVQGGATRMTTMMQLSGTRTAAAGSEDMSTMNKTTWNTSQKLWVCQSSSWACQRASNHRSEPAVVQTFPIAFIQLTERSCWLLLQKLHRWFLMLWSVWETAPQEILTSRTGSCAGEQKEFFLGWKPLT